MPVFLFESFMEYRIDDDSDIYVPPTPPKSTDVIEVKMRSRFEETWIWDTIKLE
jgi:hypothetical protein